MSNLRRITKDDYYNIIKEWANINGRSPSKEDFNNDDSLPSSRTLEENIKIPWNIALKELGLKQIKDRTYYFYMDNKELLKAFKDEYLRISPNERKDFSSRRNKIIPDAAYFEKRFNVKWNGLLKLCEFDTKREYYTKDEFTVILNNLYKKLNRNPSVPDFEKEGYTLNALLLAFGGKTYNEVISLLGFETNKTPQICIYSDEELINMYKSLCSKIGIAATFSDIDNCDSIPSSSIYMNRFTDIKKLRKLANITGGRCRCNIYSKENITKILIDLNNKYKRNLTTSELQHEIKENKYPSVTTMQRHLKVNTVVGLWNELEKECKKE